MSQAYVGDYTGNLFNASKRYRLMYQKSVALADSELREEQSTGDSFVRQLIHNNFPTGSSTDDGFKIVESSGDNVNNFTIKGGDGTVNGAGVLFVDGYMLFLKGDIEYKNQNATGALTDDDYTETSLSALTTPGAPRTDEVYVDFYFAEVSATAGSEYLDSSLVITGIGTTTANRLRMVQDIRVVEGGTIPASGTDGNGIYHYRIKIATLNRLNGDNTITNAMITDDRILVNSVQSLALGTTQTDLIMTDGQNIGDASHGVGTLYMSSVVDYSADLKFESSGEKIRFTTAGNVGVGTDNPQTKLHLSDTSTNARLRFTNMDTTTSSAVVIGAIDFETRDAGSPGVGAEIKAQADGGAGEVRLVFSTGFGGSAVEALRIRSNQFVGIGTTPQTLFHVGTGTSRLDGDLEVNGTTTTINTEIVNTDKVTINQDENQQALEINKTAVGGGNVVDIDNSGTGAALIIIGSGSNNVGIGTDNPEAILEVVGSGASKTDGGIVRLSNWDSSLVLDQGLGGIEFKSRDGSGPGAGVRASIRAISQSSTGSSTSLIFSNDGGGLDLEKMRIDSLGNVGIGTTDPQDKLHVYETSGSIVDSKIEYQSNNLTDRPRLTFLHSPTSGTTQDGTTLGDIVANGHDGNGESTGAVIRFSSDGEWGTAGDVTDSPGKIQFFTVPEGSSTLTERMVIGSDGNVGIGTTTPIVGNISGQRGLTISGGDPKLIFDNTNIGPPSTMGRINYLMTNGANLEINRASLVSGVITSPANTMTMTPAGYVGVGITPGDTFCVNVGSNEIVAIGSGGIYRRDINTDTQELSMNQVGYSGGTTRFRNFAVFNGKGGRVLHVTGSTSRVGVGTTFEKGLLHVHEGDSGQGSANSNANELVLESSLNAGMTILSGNTNEGLIYFGDDGHSSIGKIVYSHNTNSMRLFTNGQERLSILSTGFVGIGTTNPQTLLHVGLGTSRFDGDLEVNGTTTTINTETVSTDKITINQDEAQAALDINKTNVSGGNVVEINNSGTGAALLIQGSGNNFVGIGTSNPITELHINDEGGASQITLERTDATVSANDAIGNVLFRGGETTPITVARVRASAENNWGSSDSSTYLMFETANGTTLDERMRITSDGKIGIGTTTVDEQLHVYSGNAVTGQFGNVNGNIKIASSTNYNAIEGRNAADSGYESISLKAGSDPGLTLATNGFVGIGTTIPSEDLHVLNTSGTATLRLTSSASSNSSVQFGDTVTSVRGELSYSSSTDRFSFWTNGGGLGLSVDESGCVGVGTSNCSRIGSGKGRLFIQESALASFTSPSSSANNLVLESSGSTGMSIYCGDSGKASIYFAKAADREVGRITYDMNNDTFRIHTGSSFGDAAQMTIDSNARVGIGTTTRKGDFHISRADSGASSTPSSFGRNFVIEDSGNSGMSIYSGTSSTGSILFGDSTDSDSGKIQYIHGAPATMEFYTATNDTTTAKRMEISFSGTYTYGTVGATGAKTFKITHPLDDKKWLYHACVESDKLSLVYDGRDQLENGECRIQMPDWFTSLVQPNNHVINVTSIGCFVPLYVVLNDDDSIVKDGKFTIKCDDNNYSDAKFCWTLTTERADDYVMNTGKTKGVSFDEEGHLIPEMNKTEEELAKA